jgi:PAS domain S-box-containing protein
MSSSGPSDPRPSDPLLGPAMRSPADGPGVRSATDWAKAEITLETVLEGIGEGFFALDTDWRFLAFNAAAERIFSLPRAKVLGRLLWEVSPRIRGTEFERRYRRVMTERVREEFEVQSVYLTDRYHEVRAFPLGPGIGVAFRDVTERRAMENALRESEAKLKLDIEERARVEESLREREAELARVQRIGRIGGFEVDVREDFLGVRSPEYLRLHGLTQSSVRETREEWTRRIHPEDRERVVEGFRQTLESDALSYDADYRIIRPSDGEIRWISASGEIERDQDGNALRIIGAHFDITERKEAELASKESEQRFRMVADSAPVPMWVSQKDGKRSFANRAYCEFFGLSFEEALEFDFRSALHPEDAERIGAERLAGEATRAPFALEARYRQADGEWRWMRSQLRPRLGLAGEVIGLIGVAHDITAAKQAEIELRRMNETLERRVEERTRELQLAEESLRQAQKMEAVGQLTGGIAHDFNNFLQGIIGSLELISRRMEQGRLDGIQRFVTGAMSAANRATALTHRLLAFARRQPLDPRPVLANRLVTSMEELLHRTVGENVEVELALARDLWLTLCDANQLENAILNLAINARDAMLGGGKLMIRTANEQLERFSVRRPREIEPGEYVCVSIADTGVGMTTEVMARAFDPFFTTKPAGQGTGLGLSMIYGFARQSGGYARIESALGQGTTVELYLPRHLGASPGDAAFAEGLSEHMAGEGEGVLLVEDDAVVRGLILDALAELGYRVMEAEDGPSALSMLETPSKIDLLVTDIGLPGLNGRQVAEAARRSRPGLKVLFMTGYAEMAALAGGFLEPGMHLLTKPFTMEALAERIKGMVEGRS